MFVSSVKLTGEKMTLVLNRNKDIGLQCLELRCSRPHVQAQRETKGPILSVHLVHSDLLGPTLYPRLT